MESYKNKLQEYCQKRGLPIPLYEASQVLTLDGLLKWKCTVSFVDEFGDDFLISTDELFSQKKQAEMNSSFKALEIVTKPRPMEVKIYNKIYLIDFENRSKKDRVFEEEALYIGFMTKNWSGAVNYASWSEIKSKNIFKESLKSNHLLFKINGSTKELNDHSISMFSAYIASYIKMCELDTEIYIVSSDLSSMCNKICLEETLKFEEVKSKITITIIA